MTVGARPQVRAPGLFDEPASDGRVSTIGSLAAVISLLPNNERERKKNKTFLILLIKTKEEEEEEVQNK